MLVEVKHLIFSLLSDSVRSPTMNKSRDEIEAEPEFVEPRNWCPAWRAGTTTLFDVPDRQAAFLWIGSWAP